jgi:hypothetical protein
MADKDSFFSDQGTFCPLSKPSQAVKTGRQFAIEVPAQSF